MNDDRISAFHDDELTESELDALLSDENRSLSELAEAAAYADVLRETLRHGRLPPSLLDPAGQAAAIARISERLAEEPPLTRTTAQKFSLAFSRRNLKAAFRAGRVPIAAAVVILAGLLVQPLLRQETASTASESPMLADASHALDQVFGGALDDYVLAHQDLLPLTITHFGGFASLRSLLHTDLRGSED